MQPVSRLPPAARPPRPPHARVAVTTTCQARATASHGCCARPSRAAPAPRPRLSLRARATSCGGGAAEPVEARVDADPAEEEAGLAPEELEVLEEAAIAGEDEGRRPTDYDRRAHIFEESSRVFRELKHRRDGDVGDGSVTAGAAAGTREQQQQVMRSEAL